MRGAYSWSVYTISLHWTAHNIRTHNSLIRMLVFISVQEYFRYVHILNFEILYTSIVSKPKNKKKKLKVSFVSKNSKMFSKLTIYSRMKIIIPSYFENTNIVFFEKMFWYGFQDGFHDFSLSMLRYISCYCYTHMGSSST